VSIVSKASALFSELVNGQVFDVELLIADCEELQFQDLCLFRTKTLISTSTKRTETNPQKIK
jgi:hypothetical protein